MSLNTSIGRIKLDTPLMLASGYITETTEFFLKAKNYGCSSIVTRSLKKNIPVERMRVPSPRYVVFNEDSMLNCEWGNEKPWTYWWDQGIPEIKETGCPIIISLSGRDIDSCCDLIKLFDQMDVDAYEINISCSHSGSLYGNLNVDSLHLQELMKVIRKITPTPIWIKLSYSILLISMAKEAERLGADAIVCTNSIGPGMFIDTNTAKSKLGIKGGGGGVTGKAIFPIALWCVSQLSQTVSIPIIGCGGISTADDVIQMLMAGSSAVQLYTAPALKGPSIFKKIVRGLEKFLLDHEEYNSISDLVGLVTKNIDEHIFMSPIPVIINNRCTGCGICVNACAFGALELIDHSKENKLAFINNNCNSCNACVGVCPDKFNAIKASF